MTDRSIAIPAPRPYSMICLLHRAHTHACTHTHTCTHTRAYMHTYTHTRMHIHMHTHIHTDAHTHTHARTHAHTHTHTHMHAHIHTHKCMHTHTRIHAYMHTCTRNSSESPKAQKRPLPSEAIGHPISNPIPIRGGLHYFSLLHQPLQLATILLLFLSRPQVKEQEQLFAYQQREGRGRNGFYQEARQQEVNTWLTVWSCC